MFGLSKNLVAKLGPPIEIIFVRPDAAIIHDSFARVALVLVCGVEDGGWVVDEL